MKLLVYHIPAPPPPAPPAAAPAQPQKDGAAPNQQGSLPLAPGDGLAQFGGGGFGFGGMGGIAGPVIPGNDLVELITKLVEPESWSREGAYIKAVPGRLIVRQTPETHRKIARLLRRLDIDPFPGPTWGMGGGFSAF
jgi:hypothetical protein